MAATSFVPEWTGLPDGTVTCPVTAFCPATLVLNEWETLLPGRAGFYTRRPCLCFLIRHEPSNSLILFDLSLAEGWQKWLGEQAGDYEREFKVELGEPLPAQLAKKGVAPEEITDIILSHRHFDHTGDISLFPNAQIVCGPGEAAGTPSLATESARVTSVAWDDTTSPIASFSTSQDLCGDGSIVLVALHGHTPGHIGALVRTGEDEYVLLASDGCHNHLLLSHRPEDAHYALGMVLAEDAKEGDAPSVSANYEDYVEASRTLERLRVAGKREEILVVLAHDEVGWKRWEEKEGTEGVELKDWRARGLKADMVEGLK